MTKCKVLLADPELAYLAPIELLVLREYAGAVDLALVNDQEYLRRFFSEPQKLDILVINERFWSEDLRRQDIGQVFFLVEEERPKVTTRDNDIILYKYTSARDIFASINMLLRRLSDAAPARSSQLVMVYSPQGGSGKTTAALGVCAALAGIGSKPLYISADPMQAESGCLPPEAHMTDRLVHQILRGAIDPNELRANIHSGVFDCLAPMPYAMSGYGITEEQFNAVAFAANGSLSYDYVVVDCSSDFTLAKTALMKAAAHVILPFVPDAGGAAKYRRILQCINARDQEKFMFVRTLHNAPAAPDATIPAQLTIPDLTGLAAGATGDLRAVQNCNAFTELIYRFL